MERPLFSEMLAERRRELGYSIGQASRVLRLREDVLIAFEEGDFERMPKSGYAQGMLSSYARYLGLEPSVVVDAYVEDLESYRRGERRNRRGREGGRTERRSESPSVGQPYVAKRGLLPTSGGMAGDLGSFATTRVRSRDTYSGEGYDDDSWNDERAHSQEYARGYATEYPQGRPYTGRTPSNRGRGRDTVRRSRNRGEVATIRPDDYGYEDDLRFGRDVRSYEAASTGRGRKSGSGAYDRTRPSVRRRSRDGAYEDTRDKRRRPRGGSRGGQGPSRGGTRSNRMLLVVAGAVLVLSVIVVLSVASCIRQSTDDARTVPVSASAESSSQSSDKEKQSSSSTTENESGETGSKSSTTKDNASDASDGKTGTGSSQTGTGKNGKGNEETSVSVSVADEAVTWLEIQCDGKSDVAETVTGPWQKTYTVKDSMTVQAGDTKAVSVVQNGRQMQFESITAGIGKLQIQGNKTNSKSNSGTGSTGNSSTSDGSGTTGKTTSNGSSGKDASSEDVSSDEDVDATSQDGTTTIDGITYDVYGNVLNVEDSTSGSSGGSSTSTTGSNYSSNTNGY